MADLGSQLLDRIHGGPAMDAQEGTVGSGPEQEPVRRWRERSTKGDRRLEAAILDMLADRREERRQLWPDMTRQYHRYGMKWDDIVNHLEPGLDSTMASPGLGLAHAGRVRKSDVAGFGSEGQIYMNPYAASPFLAAHEAGHTLDENLPRYRSNRHERKFARRKQAEIQKGFLGVHPIDRLLNRLTYNPTAKETAASLWGSYLAFPDSVPEYTAWADSVLGERDVDVSPLRRAIRSRR